LTPPFPESSLIATCPKLRNFLVAAHFEFRVEKEYEMSLFFLHVRERGELLEDEEGQEFPSLAEAKEVAILSVRELMATRIMSGKNPDHPQIEITDDSGRNLLIVPWAQAINEG
jgi:hypothetical protein